MKMKRTTSFLLAAALCLPVFSFVPTAASCATEKQISVYKVTVLEGVGGTVTADTKSVQQGKDVTFTITPNSGYMLEALTINGGNVDVNDGVYVFSGVLCDLTVKANFIKTDVVVRYDVGENGAPIADGSVKYGKTFGELPNATATGKRFLHWIDEKGNQVRSTTTVKQSGEITLTAVWQDITEAEKAGLKPFSATTAYYDTPYLVAAIS